MVELPDPDRMEALSRAYLQTVAATAGVTLDQRSKDFGIDGTLHGITERDGRVVEAGVSLDVQLKSTFRALDRANTVAYDLDKVAYDDLRMATPRPRVLMLLVLPRAATDRVSINQRRLTLRGAMYWQSLLGWPAKKNRSSVRIEFPKRRLLTANELRRILEIIRPRGPLS